MSEEDFLARWSRRKQAATEGSEAAPVSRPASLQGLAVPATEDPAPTMEKLDVSSLPPIDSIDAATDITAYLRQGIPSELSRAALRRAWSADPAIRDFIGLAENAWDFNDPDAMPGFGPLDCSVEQLQALVGRVIGSARSVAENLADASEGLGVDRQSGPSGQLPTSQPEPQTDCSPGVADETSTSAPQHRLAAMQPNVPRDVVNDQTAARRTHGGALPR